MRELDSGLGTSGPTRREVVVDGGGSSGGGGGRDARR